MTYTWEFNTAGRRTVASQRRCHRGPMIPLEVTMSQSFTTYPGYNVIRKQLLNHLTDSALLPVQTRDAILRVLHCNLNAAFVDLKNQQNDLEVTICEKRNSVIVDGELAVFDPLFKEGLAALRAMGVDQSYLGIVQSALVSNNAIYRVSARCAVVILAAIYELRSHG